MDKRGVIEGLFFYGVLSIKISFSSNIIIIIIIFGGSLDTPPVPDKALKLSNLKRGNCKEGDYLVYC